MLTIRETPLVPPEPAAGKRDLLTYLRPPKAKISAVIITRNESRNIRLTLSRLSWCDEIVIVDSNSSDDTVEICREFGCRVFLKAFEGYGKQKRYAVAQAKNDWVLCLDADEVLSEALIREILEEFHKGPSCDGYEFPLNLVFLGREFRSGKESGRYFLRLFNKKSGGFNEALVHEKIELNGKIGRLNQKMLHFSYSSIQQWYEKCNRYTTLAAEEAVRKDKRRSVAAILLALPYYFIRYYFIDRNFLNGIEGFYWSVFSSQYHFTKYVKIRTLHGPARQVSHPLH